MAIFHRKISQGLFPGMAAFRSANRHLIGIGPITATFGETDTGMLNIRSSAGFVK